MGRLVLSLASPLLVMKRMEGKGKARNLRKPRSLVCVREREKERERYLSPHTPLTAGDKHRPVLLTT